MPAYATPEATEFVAEIFEAICGLDSEEADELGLPEIDSTSDAGSDGWLGVEGTVVRLADGRAFIVRAQEVQR